ncbi:MAG: hypothetical protein L0K86_24535, partial [Actinomycetia bacterium]|nr:hypothetical protein [Actinomycetes bacterium]
MSPGQWRGGPGHHPAAAATPQMITARQSADHGHHGTAERAQAMYVAPAGRRHLGALLVVRCPYCGGGHLHRGVGGVR